MSDYNSIQGLQGVQGTRGVQGYQGYRGIQGPQGKPGLPGYKGVQGIRGTQGTTGYNGTNGVQGLQGKPGIQGTRGCQGVNGLRGTQGVQGVQGKKGLRGSAGYMGYQGDTGEVGIQGLQGESGYAVFFDGIRMNGFNTNLFKYDIFNTKFVSVNNSVPDLLKIGDGSVIKIWMNTNAFNRIVETNTIEIDTLINGEMVPTNYPAYYSDNYNISELLLNTSAVNTVVEFTFKDNAWHYSGGIVGGGSGGGDAIFTHSFEVMGMNLGEMTDGTQVNVGDRIETVVKKMLTKVVDVAYTLPKQRLTINITLNRDYEVGSTINFRMNASLTDGYFESANKEVYSNEAFDRINSTSGGKLSAGCGVEYIEYYNNGVLQDSPDISIVNINPQSYTFGTKIKYTESTVVPKKNNSENSEVKINDGITALLSFGLNGKYKAFFGYIEKIISSDETPYENVFTNKSSLSVLTPSFIENGKETTICEELQSTDALSSMALVIPATATITSLSNKFGPLSDPYEKFKLQNSFDYTNGNTTTVYNVYVLHSLYAAEYKNLKIRN